MLHRFEKRMLYRLRYKLNGRIHPMGITDLSKHQALAVIQCVDRPPLSIEEKRETFNNYKPVSSETRLGLMKNKTLEKTQMIQIQNPEIFAKCVADALVRIEENPSIQTFEKLRAVNAVAKAVNRIQKDGCFMEYSGDDDRLVIWSQGSNNVYEMSPGRSCGCRAAMNGVVCWHRSAKRLIVLYNAAMLRALASDYVAGRSLETATPKVAVVERLQPSDMPYLKQTEQTLNTVGGVRF